MSTELVFNFMKFLLDGEKHKEVSHNKSKIIEEKFLDKFCIIRTCSAGVHYGYLRYYDTKTKDVVLQDARRIHYWRGAFTLSAIANGTIDLDQSRISEPVDFIKLTEIEILPMSSKGIRVLKLAKTHEI